MLDANLSKVVMLPIHDSFIVSLRDYGLLHIAMHEAMKKNSGIDVPITVVQREPSGLTVRLSKHWEQFDSYDPSPDNPPDSELANQFVPGYEGYQRRVGEMIKKQHRQVFV